MHNDDGMITAFLRSRQDQYTVVMLDEMEKPKDLVNEGGWDQSKPIYKSFLEPWQEGTIQNPGQQAALDGDNANAGARERSINCSKCIFICTTNLAQEQIVAFAEQPENARRMRKRMGEGDIAWLREELERNVFTEMLVLFF